MVTRILKTKESGNVVYDNKGSSERLINYLKHEAKGNNSPDIYFFNQSEINIKSDDVLNKIDNNIKGVKATDSKFFTLIISPSQDELNHIKNDEKKLIEYTQKVMENYGNNFQLNNEKKIQKEDLVWFATIHQERKFSGTDEAVKEGSARSGTQKPGLQTHIHVIVSRRDAEQKITLSPEGNQKRFSKADWTLKNIKDFNLMFNYHPPKNLEYEEKKLRERVGNWSKNYPEIEKLIEIKKVVKIAKERGFEGGFYRDLKKIEQKLEKGELILNPYHILAGEKPNRKAEYLAEKIEKIKNNFDLTDKEFDAAEISRIGKEKNYSDEFYKSLRNVEKEIKETWGVPQNYLERLGNTKTYPTPINEKIINEKVDNLSKDSDQEKMMSISKSVFDIGYEGDSPEDYVRKKRRRNNINRPSFN
jgi:hypothetical protein